MNLATDVIKKLLRLQYLKDQDIHLYINIPAADGEIAIYTRCDT